VKSLRGLTRGAAKIGLVGIVFGIAALTLAKDGRPAAGVTTTEIFASLSGTSPTYAASVMLVRGGSGGSGFTPCSPGDTTAATTCLYIWAKNVNNTTGASGFQVHATYPATDFGVSGLTGSTVWLQSTQRSGGCKYSPLNGPGDYQVDCSTLQAPPPYGPNCPSYCDGLLASFAIFSHMSIGTYTFNLSPPVNPTLLADTPPNPDNVAAIPVIVRSTSIIVAPCADFTVPPDGTVRVADILYVVGKYHTNDVLADLSADGMVRVNDILIAVGEYHTDCTA
jgi:hypothetical protein